MALYTYESPEVGDLTFVEGDVVLVTEREGEWWRGCIGDKTGLFPSNYVRPVEPDVSKSSLRKSKYNNKNQVISFGHKHQVDNFLIFLFRHQDLELQLRNLVIKRHRLPDSVTLTFLTFSSCNLTMICLSVHRDRPGSNHHIKPHHTTAPSVSRTTDRRLGQELHRLVAWGIAGHTFDIFTRVLVI